MTDSSDWIPLNNDPTNKIFCATYTVSENGLLHYPAFGSKPRDTEILDVLVEVSGGTASVTITVKKP